MTRKSAPSADAPPTADDLSLLDGPLRAELREAIATLNGQHINLLLRRLEPAQPSLVSRIRKMLDRAQHQHLWKILG